MVSDDVVSSSDFTVDSVHCLTLCEGFVLKVMGYLSEKVF